MRPSNERWNAVRYDGQQDHVESYFLKATAPDSRRAIWFKATIFASGRKPGEAVAEGWAIAFDHREGRRQIAVKHSLPLAAASFGRAGLAIDWQLPNSDDSMHLAPGEARGAISTTTSRISWDLELAGDDRPIVPYPYERMYTAPFPSSKTVTPCPDVRFRGQVVAGDDRWDIADWHGMQGHNWGRGHTEQYAWCHCNQWAEPTELVLEAMSARLRVGPVLTPTLTVVCVRHRGVDYPFNRPHELLLAEGDIGLRSYSFQAKSKQAEINALFEAQVDDFAGLRYHNPRGEMTHCLNSKLAAGRVWFRARGRPPLELATGAAALEVGTKRPDHGVRMLA